MESKLNYTLVGVFVVALLAAMIASSLWLSGQNKDQQFNYYRIQMTESISGLGMDSVVKYLGVDVGNVTQIRLDPDNSQQVEILIRVEQNVPVTEQTVATLKFFGITGLAFIELSGSPQGAKPIISSPDQLAIIKAGSSTFSRVEESLNTLAIKLSRVLDHLDHVMNEGNIENFSALLEQSNQLIFTLQQDQQKLSKLLEQGTEAGQSMEDAFAKMGVVADRVNGMTDNLSMSGKSFEKQLNSVLQDIAVTSKSVDKLVQDYANLGDQTAEEVQQTLHDFRQSLQQLDSVMGVMKNTVQSVEDSPSDLLFKHREQKLGPGEG